jgi:hypothetical protein
MGNADIRSAPKKTHLTTCASTISVVVMDVALRTSIQAGFAKVLSEGVKCVYYFIFVAILDRLAPQLAKTLARRLRHH